MTFLQLAYSFYMVTWREHIKSLEDIEDIESLQDIEKSYKFTRVNCMYFIKFI